RETVAVREVRSHPMSSSSIRSRALLVGIFAAALVVAPLSIAGAARPAVIPNASHAVRPSLPQTPRTFPPAQVSFTVNTANDTDAANPASGLCADSGGQCSIRAALDVANTIQQTVNVTIPAGTYQLTLSNLDVTDPAGVQLIGAGAATTTIVGFGGNDVLNVATGG